MKHFNLFFALLMTAFISTAQETTVDLSLNANYSEELYFKFDTQHFETYNADAWEIAFLRTSAFDFGERINTFANIEVYEASDNPMDYDSIDPLNIENWTRLYNSDNEWGSGAFDQGSATYGWGNYDPSSHHIKGEVVFVLKYPNDTYKKFMIEDYFDGYTFKYATWDANNSNWTNEQSVILPNSNNPNKMFNHYTLTNNEEVITSPDLSNWDIVFQKYETDIQGMKYPVLGVLQHPDVTVAKSNTLNVESIDDLEFSSQINTIGHDWKELNNDFQYQIVADQYYFLKYEDGSIYRFYFTSFEGASTGNFSLSYEDVTQQLDIEEFDKNNTFSLFPNPITQGELNLLYDTNANIVTISIYDITGKKIISKTQNINGFTHSKLDVSHLTNGTYLLKFEAGQYHTTKKIIVN